ncbi:MAG: myo-inositol-1-phosphate synthase [Desulfurococcaceae archaeon]
MIRVAIIGQGLVALHFEVGLEKLKNNEIPEYGVPLRDWLPYRYNDIEIVASYDVDEAKVGKTVYELAKKYYKSSHEIPGSLKDIIVRRGIHLDSLKGLPFKAHGREEEKGFKQAVEEIIDEWRELGVNVIVNIMTTEPVEAIGDPGEIHRRFEKNGLTASQTYAYMGALYASKYGSVAFVNAIPSPLANDPGFVELYRESKSVIFGDDGATGATPITADLLEHMYERNRRVLDIAQFNIGGNTDFLSLNLPERNIMKKKTKSAMVEDILGYEAPNYIRPTGYLEPLGDKKFVAMIIEYMSFGEFVDEIYLVMRINDSPALAGLLVDLVRLGKIAIEREAYGTVYEINAFYMKRPGPRGSKAISKYRAFSNLLSWLGIKDPRFSTQK